MKTFCRRIERPARARRGLWAAGALAAAGWSAARAEAPHCAGATAHDIAYVVCRFDPAKDDIRLFHARADGEPFRHFGKLAAALGEKGERLVFAMNAGMYHPNRAPVGLYVEGRVTRAPVNNRDCRGNFCMKPNGVFWISDNKEGLVRAHVTPTGEFEEAAHFVRDATQSGPMLVIDGEIHPKFLKGSTSRYRRNGVGVTAQGEAVFAISDAPVTFHEFATFFRDELKTPNALYFDGAISRVYAAELVLNEPGAAMGPMVAVVAPVRPEEGTRP